MSFLNPFATTSAPPAAIKYLTADEAKGIDAELMGPEGAFSLDQVSSLHPCSTSLPQSCFHYSRCNCERALLSLCSQTFTDDIAPLS